MELVELLLGITVLLLVVVLFGFHLSWRATRLDRLHARIETARAALDAALLQRCAVVLDVATSGMLDPASAVILAEAEKEARDLAVDGTLGPQRAAAERDLGEAVKAFLDQPDLREQLCSDPRTADRGMSLLAELEAASHRVIISMQFYNETVAITLRSRERWLARLFRLSGSAPAPTPFAA